MSASAREGFSRLVGEVEPGLRRALCVRFGGDQGREATADALAWAWEHWDQVQYLDNPAGYLFRVAQRRTFRSWRRPRWVPDPPPESGVWVEPKLHSALRRLTSRQRTAVVLMHGFGWTHREVAQMMGISIASVQKHQERAMKQLRRTLGVTIDV